MDTENPHPSAFRELMSAAGYKTGTALARDLRLPNTTVYGWITGKRLPENVGRCSYVAEFFSSKTGIPLTPARLLELFRKGTLDNLSPTLDNLSPTLAKGLNRHGALTGLSEGDPCPRGHGCNGTIVLPTDGAARTWWVKLTCKTCPETWTVAIGDYHGQYCPKCLATPRSELDEILKRRACTVRDCAQAIGYPLRTVDGWAAGGHPPENLERLQSLCAFVETPLEEAGATIAIPGSGYTLFWKQTVGDPCPNPKHGASCRGVLTPPVDPKAQYLDIMIPCLDCGTPIFHRGENRYQHHDSQYCRDHGIKHRRKPRKPGPAVLPKDPSRRVWKKCPGYKPFRAARRAIHVDDCRRRVERARSRLKFRKSDAFKLCSFAAVKASNRETWITDFLEGARKDSRELPELAERFRKITGRSPLDDIPRIQSSTELKKQLRWCYALWSYIDEHGNEKVFELARRLKNKPKPTARKYERLATGGRIPAALRHVAGGFMWRWRNKPRLTYLRGECERCHTWNPSPIPNAKSHGYCLVNDIHEPPSGRPVSLRVAQKYALLALLQACGMSLTDLEAKTGLARKNLVKAIRKGRTKWPETNRLEKRYQRIFSLVQKIPKKSPKKSPQTRAQSGSAGQLGN